MKLLAFDTSNQPLSVALLEDNKPVAELSLTIKKNHSISLMPTIDFLLSQAGWQPADLNRIVVAQGPGSYTGLRVAVATAKTLAYSLGIDLVGLSSLQALCSIEASGLIVPLIDARRQNVYACFYEDGKLISPEGHASLVEVLEFAKSYPQVTFVGEAEKFRSEIETYLPQAKIQETLPSATFLGRLGASLPAQDVHAFVPNYLKRVEAEENWLKSHREEETNDYIKRV